MRCAGYILLFVMLAGCASSDRLDRFKDAMLGKPDIPEALTLLSPAEETLVTEAALKKTTINGPTGAASFEYDDKGYRIVAYAKKTGRTTTQIKVIVRDNKVHALSEQPVLAPLDPYAFTYAAEIVHQNANGSYSPIPALYQGRAFVPQKYDNCTILVREKDHEKEYFVYRFNICSR